MKTISTLEFNKKVEIEFAHLSYMQRMTEIYAKQQALANVSKEYKVGLT